MFNKAEKRKRSESRSNKHRNGNEKIVTEENEMKSYAPMNRELRSIAELSLSQTRERERERVWVLKRK